MTDEQKRVDRLMGEHLAFTHCSDLVKGYRKQNWMLKVFICAETTALAVLTALFVSR